jgi:chromate transport protein ChrA
MIHININFIMKFNQMEFISMIYQMCSNNTQAVIKTALAHSVAIIIDMGLFHIIRKFGQSCSATCRLVTNWFSMIWYVVFSTRNKFSIPCYIITVLAIVMVLFRLLKIYQQNIFIRINNATRFDNLFNGRDCKCISNILENNKMFISSSAPIRSWCQP